VIAWREVVGGDFWIWIGWVVGDRFAGEDIVKGINGRLEVF